MQKIKFYLLDATYKIVDGKACIQLFGRTPQGARIRLVDTHFEPFFYVQAQKKLREELLNIKTEHLKNIVYVTRCEEVSKNLFEKETSFFKVFVNIPAAVPVIKDVVKDLPNVSDVFEYDIPFARRYLIDKELVPMKLIEAECSDDLQIQTIKTIDQLYSSPSVLAVDIETYFDPMEKRIIPEENPILMIALYGNNCKKVLTWKEFPKNDPSIEVCETEAAMIARFVEIVKEHAPDIIAGYYSDGFDLPYLDVRAKKHKILLDFGAENAELRIRGRSIKEAEINGVVHVDVFKFIRKVISRSMETDVFTLDAVAAELLGAHKHEVDLDELSAAWNTNHDQLEKFCQYNLHDAKLTYDLCLKILPTMIEFTSLIGLTLFDSNRMSFSQLVEAYIMKNAHAANEIAPNKPTYSEKQDRMNKRIQGAFVFEPKPGLYKNIVVFDYRSLYPSIIASHNISPGSLNCDCCKGKALVPTERGTYWFCDKKKGFLSLIIEHLIMVRADVKELIKKGQKDAMTLARSEALKVLANSFYGYLGFYGARWYCKEGAEATTAFGRQYIHKVIDTARAEGFTVLYSDSLPYDRMLVVKKPNKDVHVTKIGSLYKEFVQGSETLAYENNRVVFKKIVRVIRHKFSGMLLRIMTRYGSTIVTKSHSVYSYKKGLKLVDAGKLKVGDCLVSLTNPQLPTKYREGHVFDVTKLNMSTYTDSLRLYNDDFVFPKKRGVCPYCKKNVELSTHVSIEHSDRKQKFSASTYSLIGGVNAGIGRIPRYWTLDTDLAWLLGFYCAEGSVSDVKTKTGRKALLSFGGQNSGLIKKVKAVLDKKTGTNTKIIRDFDKRINKFTYYYRLQRMPIVPLFQYGFDAGKGSEFKRVPFFILAGEESLKRAFLEGYLDGDGNQYVDARYKTKFIRFSTKSKELAIGLQVLLKSLPGGFNAWKKEIKHVAWGYRNDKPKINTLRFQSAKESYQNFCCAEIVRIQEIPGEEYVYDVEVEDCHNFVDAEGLILVHNTDSVFLLLDKKTKSDALAFIKRINDELPGVMELDFEGLYPAGIFVATKTSEGGAKKKYALIDEKGVLKIRGFETVRRNWSFIAKDAQKEVLNIILREHDPEKAAVYLRGIIKDLRKNAVPLEKVVIHTQLQRDVSSYKSIGPHVAAAQRMKNRDLSVEPGMMMRFVIVKGKGKIRDKVRLVDEATQADYDAEYYINNQVLPSVERIFAVLGYSEESFLAEKTQRDINTFF